MEKLNIDLEEDITCPCCHNNNKRFFLKFYCDKVINLCMDCGFWEEI